MGTTPGRAQRPAAIAFAVLLVAVAGAFLLANRLKSAPAEIEVIKRDAFFSPNGDGRREREVIRFRIDQTDTAAIDIVDADGARVRRVEEEVQLRAGRRMKVVWDGRDDDGAPAPDGEYRMRLILGQGRSLLAPRQFFVDTVAPRPTVEVAEDATIVTPGAPVDFTLAAELDAGLAPRFSVLRTDVSPPREVRAIRGELGRSDYQWDGNTGLGTPADPGTYLIQVTAYDRAQNATTTPMLPLSPGGAPARTARTGGCRARSRTVTPEAAVRPPGESGSIGVVVAFCARS